MRYDKNYAYFTEHPEWYTVKPGVGFIPTEKAPERAKEAMKEYNSYTFGKEKKQ